MIVKTIFLSIVVTIIVIGCGGGSGGDASEGGAVDEQNPELLTANNYSEYITKLYPYIGGSRLIDELETYNARPVDFPSVYDYFTQNNVIQGTYQVTPAPNQALVNEWPNITADIHMKALSTDKSLQEWSYDHYTDVYSELGDTQIFFGVKDIEYIGNNNTRVPIAIIIEETPHREGVPLYRALRIFIGWVYGGNRGVDGSPSYKGPGSLILGYNYLYSIEDFSGVGIGLLNEGQQNILWYWVRIEDDIPGNKSPVCTEYVNSRTVFDTNVLSITYSEALERCTDPDGDSMQLLQIILDERADEAKCQINDNNSLNLFELINNPPENSTNCSIIIYVADQYGNETNYLDQITFSPFIASPF